MVKTDLQAHKFNCGRQANFCPFQGKDSWSSRGLLGQPASRRDPKQLCHPPPPRPGSSEANLRKGSPGDMSQSDLQPQKRTPLWDHRGQPATAHSPFEPFPRISPKLGDVGIHTEILSLVFTPPSTGTSAAHTISRVSHCHAFRDLWTPVSQ